MKLKKILSFFISALIFISTISFVNVSAGGRFKVTENKNQIIKHLNHKKYMNDLITLLKDDAYFSEKTSYPQKFAKAIYKIINEENSTVYILFDTQAKPIKKIIGIIYTQKQDENTTYISHLVIHPRCRGCGLAKRLVKHALRRGETDNYYCVPASENLVGFFEKMGIKCLL